MVFNNLTLISLVIPPLISFCCRGRCPHRTQLRKGSSNLECILTAVVGTLLSLAGGDTSQGIQPAVADVFTEHSNEREAAIWNATLPIQ